MSHRQTVWVDADGCTGCGACIEICPVGAVSLVGGKASLDQRVCTGCQACVDACPESAIQPLVHGEIVTVEERTAPAVQRARPLAETAGVAVAAASAGVLAEVAGRVARAVGRWLVQGVSGGRQAALTTSSPQQRKSLHFPAETETDSLAVEPPLLPGSRGRTGRGRKARRRHRGR